MTKPRRPNRKPEGGQSLPAQKKLQRVNSNSAHAQRQRLLAWLKEHGSIDTITARRELDILGVAPRIHELRHRFGYAIDTVRVDRPTDCGKQHRVALYVLRSEG